MYISRRFLIGVLFFNALTAFVGGVGVMINGLGMPLEWLANSPFPDYFFPGLILFLVVGGGSLAAFVLMLVRWHWAHEATYIAGFIMIGWIVGEFIFVRQFSWLQIFYLFDGLLVLALAYIAYSKKSANI